MPRYSEDELKRLLRDNQDVSSPEWDTVDVPSGTERVYVYPSGKRTEHSLQRAVIDECNRRGLQDERWNMVAAIPNGGMRDKVTAGKLKKEGVRAGIPDLFIPIPRPATDTERAYHGAFIELKVGKNKPTENQERWISALKEQGYAVSVIWDSPEDVVRWIEWYFLA